tara:strand:+ start:901 stop:1134 length:234 start_codon:yes stop_codon:yes gene_type:complete
METYTIICTYLTAENTPALFYDAIQATSADGALQDFKRQWRLPVSSETVSYQPSMIISQRRFHDVLVFKGDFVEENI